MVARTQVSPVIHIHQLALAFPHVPGGPGQKEKRDVVISMIRKYPTSPRPITGSSVAPHFLKKGVEHVI